MLYRMVLTAKSSPTTPMTSQNLAGRDLGDRDSLGDGEDDDDRDGRRAGPDDEDDDNDCRRAGLE